MEAQELLRRVIDGDERAWDEVVDRFAGLVWSVARSYRLSSAATDDVVQTVWLRLAEHAAASGNRNGWRPGWRPRRGTRRCG